MSEHARALIAAARAAGRTSLDEASGKALLAGYGIEVPKSVVVPHGADLGKALQGLQPPYVLKVMSPDILHKSDVGGVRVRLRDAAEVEAAMREMCERTEIARARLDGFLIEELAPAGQEVVIGGMRDPQFGPLVMVGLGGILIEVLQDVSFRICPIERIDALEMLDELKGKSVLEGVRGRAVVSKAATVDALMKIGGPDGLLTALGDEIAEADINPLIVSAERAVAVDARFILARRGSA